MRGQAQSPFGGHIVQPAVSGSVLASRSAPNSTFAMPVCWPCRDRHSRQATVIDYFALDPEQRVFSLGHGEPQITLRSQQVRALNLGWALTDAGLITAASRVAIVGGGVAGLTIAAALAGSQASITLVERTETLLSVQLGSHTRFIHPNIFDWPLPSGFAPATTLPVLNWRAAIADTVARGLLEAFAPFVANIDVRLAHEVVGPIEPGAQVMLAIRPARGLGGSVTRELFDVVILTVGFGAERSLSGAKAVPYWRDDDLHQSEMHANVHRTVAIIGAGDGGVTDALRACLNHFDHGKLLNATGQHPETLALGRQMLQLDQPASQDSRGAGLFLKEKYADLEVPPFLLELVRRRRRLDTTVTLFEAQGSPYQPSASLLNRVLLLAALKEEVLAFEGQLASPSVLSDFDLRVPRIGPTDALKPLLPDGLVIMPREPALGRSLANDHYWSPASFGRGGTRRPRLHVGIVQNEADRHNRDLVDRIRIGIQEHNHGPHGAYLALSDLRVESARLGDDVYRRAVFTNLEAQRFSILIIPNSDVAQFAAELALASEKTILCCEASTLFEVAPHVEAALGKDNVLLVPQVLDIEFMLRSLKLGFSGKRLCYIRSEDYPVDGVYLHLLCAGLADAGDGYGGVELFEHVITDGDFSRLPKADAYCGRYFVHAHAPPGFAQDHPVISGYATDFEAGAIAVLDINDAESGQRLMDDFLAPLALGHAPPERSIEIRDMFLGLNVSQGRRFGLEFPSQLISLATNILE